MTAREGGPGPSSAADFAAWKRSNIFEDLAPSYDDEHTLTGQGAPQLLIGYAVSANYLHILGVEPQLGRLYTSQEDRPGGPPVALLSNSLWRTTFHSDPEIIGKPITLDGNPFTVLGVMPSAFNYPSSVQIWTTCRAVPAGLRQFRPPMDPHPRAAQARRFACRGAKSHQRSPGAGRCCASRHRQRQSCRPRSSS